MSRAPFVAVRTDIRKEERVAFIADHAGYNAYEALGRLTSLWCWCTDRGLEDAPDDCPGYAVPDAVVRRFLGPRGVEAILGDGCDELAMGERRSDGLIYLRGTSDTVERLRGLRASSVAGGRGRAEKARREGGRFAPNLVVQPTYDQPMATSPEPARSSEIPDPRSQIRDTELPPARARAASDLADQERADRRAVQLELRTALALARREVAAELGEVDHGLLAQDPGERDLAAHLLAAGPDGLATARLQGLHAIAMAKLEASTKRELQWLTGAVFADRQFRRLVGMTAADAKRAGPKSRSGPSGAVGRVEPHEPSAYGSGDQKL